MISQGFNTGYGSNVTHCAILSCAPGADLRTDLAFYRIYRDGKLTEEVCDIKALWQDDFVSFLLGCSFSFEDALVRRGIPVRHQEQGCNVPMYTTNIPTHSGSLLNLARFLRWRGSDSGFFEKEKKMGFSNTHLNIPTRSVPPLSKHLQKLGPKKYKVKVEMQPLFRVFGLESWNFDTQPGKFSWLTLVK